MRHSIVRSFPAISSVVVWLGAAGCSSTYHPEYHPVTVSNFSQNLSYPVAVNGGNSIERPVYVVPAPQSAVMVPGVVPPAELPPDFFR